MGFNTKTTLAVAALSLAALSTWQYSASEEAMACSCAPDVAFDKGLPLSHPTNRCALEHTSHVSWGSWLRGANQSHQFHFLDLLELLSRQSDDTTPPSPAA